MTKSESANGLSEIAQIFTDNHSTLAATLVGGSFSNTIPAAYLSYVYFDKDFNFKHGDMIGIGEVYPLATNMNQYYLELTDVEFDEPGYVMVYLSYEGTQHHVLFDDFTITHTESAVVQGDDYYPFALTFNSYQRVGNQANRFKYNSFELQNDLNFNLYDYQARYYDPALGRFTTIDPATDLMRRFSQYSFAFDNPLRFMDPDGMVPQQGDRGKKKSHSQQRTERTRKVVERNRRIVKFIVDGLKAVDKFIDERIDPKSSDLPQQKTDGPVGEIDKFEGTPEFDPDGTADGNTKDEKIITDENGMKRGENTDGPATEIDPSDIDDDGEFGSESKNDTTMVGSPQGETTIINVENNGQLIDSDTIRLDGVEKEDPFN